MTSETSAVTTTDDLPQEPDPGTRRLSTAKAMVEAIAQQMRADDSVFVTG